MSCNKTNSVNSLVNPILHRIKSNLFYAEGGIYAPMISRKKSFLPDSFCTLKQLPKIGLHTKTRSIPRKTKKWSSFLNMLEQLCQYFAFFTSSH